jgi:hypothetical protein
MENRKEKREREEKEKHVRENGIQEINHIPHHETKIEEVLGAIFSTWSVMQVKA